MTNYNKNQLQAIVEATNMKLQSGKLDEQDIRESSVMTSILLSQVCSELENLNSRLDKAIGENNNTDGGE